MRFTPCICLMVLFGFLARDGEAAEGPAFRIAGSVRMREDILDGQFRPGFNENQDLFSMRSTLLAEWKHDNWRLGAELYDSRAYGADAGDLLSTGEVNAFEFVQAYAVRNFPDALGKDTSAQVQVGRFTMNLGSRRLVAADDFRNTTSGYTGVRADFSLRNKTAITAFYTLPQERRPDDIDSLRHNDIQMDHESFDLQLWGLLASKSGLPGRLTAEAEYVGLKEADEPGRPTRNRDLSSFSGRVIRDPKPGEFDYEAEGIVQTGSIRSSAAANASLQDVSAWFVHVDAGRTFDLNGKPRLSLEYDYATGDDSSTSYGRFDTLFGMRRADLAPSSIYALLGRTNLQTLGLRLESAVTPRLDGFAAARAIWAASATDQFSTSGVRDASGASGRFGGYQFDARIRYWLVPQTLRAEFNGDWLLKRGLLRDAPNATPYGNTLFLSFAVTASFGRSL
ncbi:MAG: alginate export family protein [Pseudomonadota bacterium]